MEPMIRKIRTSSLYNTLCILSGLLLTCSCEKIGKDSLINLSTDSVSGITFSSCTVKGTLSRVDKLGADEHGFCYSTSEKPTIDDFTFLLGATTSTGTFTGNLTELTANTVYYVRAFAKNRSGEHYGAQLSFSTLAFTKPSVETDLVENLTDSSATLGGRITSDGGSGVSERGIWYGPLQNPETNGAKMILGSDTGRFSVNVGGLEPEKLYYYKAYAVNGVGIGYGIERSFSTPAKALEPPVAEASEASSVTNTTATLNGAVDARGNIATVTFEYGTTSLYGSVITASQSPVSGTGTTLVTAGLSGLSPGMLYHFRVKASGEGGIGYSDDLTFKTLQLPEAVTDPATNISNDKATLNGTVNASNLSTTVSFEYGTSPAFGSTVTATPNPVSGGTATGVYAALSGLDCNTTYYFRVSATNSSGTAFGEQASFTTSACLTLPSVTTNSITNVTSGSVQGGGYVTNDGGAVVTERGLCWGTSPNPTIDSDNFSVEGSGEGSFTGQVSGLTRITVYYLRAYATNSQGTAYGNEISFKTLWDNSTLTDLDGNVYQTVQIGEQIWMAENLKVTRYANGNPITLVTSTAVWDAFTFAGEDRAYCYYDNLNTNRDIYGALYTWWAATKGAGTSDAVPSGIQGVCPSGWHLPSDAEWKVLEGELGMSAEQLDALGNRGTDEGGKLKEAGTGHWYPPNEGATNSSGFTALPGGQRTTTGAFAGDETSAYFWSATQDGNNAIIRNLSWSLTTVKRSTTDKRYGVSVRCIRD